KAICRVMPMKTSRQSTDFLWLENNQVMPINTARPNRPKATRAKPSIQFTFGMCLATAQVMAAGAVAATVGLSIAGHDPVAALAFGDLQPAVGATEQV